MIKIHAFPRSPRGFKVLAVANQLGLDYEFCFLDLTKGEQRAPAYAALNPNMKMPTIEDGDFALWESNAIIQYLALKQPEARLMPSDDQGRFDVMRWLFWDSTTWDPPCATLISERLVKSLFGRGDPDPVEIGKGEEKFHFAARILNQQLEGRAFLLGDAPTVADFAIAAPLIAAAPAQMPLETYAHIVRWGADVADLPGWRKTLAM
jgi:glutathione S-transferase